MNLIKALGDNAIAEEFKLRNFLFRDTKRASLYNQDVVDLLKSNYQANDYLIDLVTEGPDIMVEAIKNTTDGFLTVPREALEPYFNDQLVNVIMNILYFKDAWTKEFTESDILKKDFYNGVSAPVSIDMLCGKRKGIYFENDYFKSGSLSFKNLCRIYFILPKGDYSVGDCLNHQALYSIVDETNAKTWADIDYQIPMFDVNYGTDLTHYLKDEGLDQVFASRDDSPFYSDIFGYGLVKQYSRIKLDEQGVKAASATYGGGATESEPEELKTMHLDRPFIYVITTTDDVILFSGIINTL